MTLAPQHKIYTEDEMSLIREYDLRANALSNIQNYVNWMRGSHPLFDFEPAPHHVVIIEAIEALERGDIRRLAINVPVGHGKSHWANLVGLSWMAARHPEWSILAVSGRLNRALDFARQRRKIIETPRWSLLSGVAPDPKLTAPELIPYGTGAMHACSIGQGIAGLRCDMLCVDDAIAAAEDASTPDKRQKMIDWYTQEARTRARLGEGNFLRELYIGSKWFSDDLIGRLLEDEGDTWHVIDLPFECIDPATDAMGRQNVGDLLWPVDMFTPAKIAELKRDPVAFQALYQQQPLNSVGAWADPESLQVFTKAPADLQYYCAMDLAASGQTAADYSVIGVVGVDHELNMWITEWHRRRMDLEDVVDLLQDIRTRWNPNRFLIENDLGSKYFAGMARVESRKYNQNIVLTEVATGGQNKETRAVNIPSMLRKGQIISTDGNWVPALKQEIGTFPRIGKKYFDDQIDVLSILSRYHPKMAAGMAPAVPREAAKPVVGGITVTDGTMHTTQTLDDLWSSNTPIRMGIRRI